MSKKTTVRIWFCDLWPALDPEDNLIIRYLREKYEVTMSPVDPQILFYGIHGQEYLKYPDCIRVSFTGENVVPDFNLCDYGIGFHHLDFGKRYLRFPYFPLYMERGDLNDKKALLSREGLADRKFCSFVFSNSKYADPVREAFFEKLSGYRRVDSGGGLRNNIGGPVADKVGFMSDYKFSIAFENSSVPGYVTEKLVDSMRAGTVPIYWGDPTVDMDFNPDSFIWMRSAGDMDAVIEEIKELDNDPVKYMEKLSQPWLRRDVNLYYNQLQSFLYDIVDNGSVQRSNYGRNIMYERDLKRWVYRSKRMWRQMAKDKIKKIRMSK